MNYTSIEQSKKLLELGLSPESADMFYNEEPDETYLKDIVDTKYPMILREGYIRFLEEYGVFPCWSLGALLEVMPIIKKGIDEYLPYFIKGSEIWKGKIQSFWYCSYVLLDDSNTELTTFKTSTAVEAAYSMVAWLLENGYIKKESDN